MSQVQTSQVQTSQVQISQVQTYRLQFAARQNRRLLLYLALATIWHGGVALGLAVWRPDWFQAQPDDTPVAIDFVDVSPTAASATPPPKTKQRAITNSTAGGRRTSERSVEAGQSANQSSPTAPTQPTAAQPAPAQPAQPPSVPSYSAASAAQSSRVAQLSRPAPQTPASRSQPSPQPNLTPAPVTPPVPSAPPTAANSLAANPPAPASALGGSLNYAVSINGGATNRGSTSGVGQNGQLNPDRNAAAAGVDATQDALWGGYYRTLTQTVRQYWQLVPISETRETKVQFRINRQGRLTDIRLLQTSGDDSADRAALEAVRAAAPFAPLPQHALEDTLIVNFTFTQSLNSASP